MDAEQALLGLLLYNNDLLDQVRDLVSPDALYEPLHGRIFSVIEQIKATRRRANPITMRPYFEGERVTPNMTVVQYLGTLVANMPAVAEARDLACEIREMDIARRIARAGIELRSRPANGAMAERIAKASAEIAMLADEMAAIDGSSSLEYVCEKPLESGALDLIDGLLSSGSVSVLYGPSRAGKTFLALDMAFSIALGQEFMGRATQQGAVLYVPLEGLAGFLKRAHAITRERGHPGRAFARLTKSGPLGTKPESAAFVSAIISNAKTLAQCAGMPLRLIIVDTLAVALAGDDENSAGTMGAVLTHCNKIARETHATVLLVAHPGKDRERGIRGSYALFGGLDDAIEIEREEGASLRSIVIRKHRDGEEGPAGSFTLERVEVGTNADGSSITSCVVRPADTAPAGRLRRRPHDSTATGKALAELERLVIDDKYRLSRGHSHIPDGAKVVDIETWRIACRLRRLSPEGEHEDSERKAFNRARQALSRDGFIAEYNSGVWLLAGHQASVRGEAQNAQ